MRRKETPKDRMQKVLNVIGISANEFENRCELGHGFVTRLTHSVSKGSRAKVKKAFPTLNMDYVCHTSPSTPSDTRRQR